MLTTMLTLCRMNHNFFLDRARNAPSVLLRATSGKREGAGE